MEPEELLEKLLKEGGIKNPMLMQANVYIGLNKIPNRPKGRGIFG